MALIERLISREDDKIPIHALVADYEETVRGKITAQDIKDDFSMDTSTGDELDDLIVTNITGRELKDVLYLAESLTRYTDAASIRTRLGI